MKNERHLLADRLVSDGYSAVDQWQSDGKKQLGLCWLSRAQWCLNRYFFFTHQVHVCKDA